MTDQAAIPTATIQGQVSRPEFERQTLDASNIGDLARPLSFWERIINVTAVSRVFIILVLCCIWQAYAQPLDNPLIFPTFTDTVTAWWQAMVSGVLPARVWVSLR